MRNYQGNIRKKRGMRTVSVVENKTGFRNERHVPWRSLMLMTVCLVAVFPCIPISRVQTTWFVFVRLGTLKPAPFFHPDLCISLLRPFYPQIRVLLREKLHSVQSARSSYDFVLVFIREKKHVLCSRNSVISYVGILKIVETFTLDYARLH